MERCVAVTISIMLPKPWIFPKLRLHAQLLGLRWSHGALDCSRPSSGLMFKRIAALKPASVPTFIVVILAVC